MKSSIVYPSRTRVFIARCAIIALYFGSFGWSLRGNGILYAVLGSVIYTVLGIIMGFIMSTAMGLPLPWEVKIDEDR